MELSEFYQLRKRKTYVDYSIFKIGEVVEVPLLGREILTAQKTLLCHAKRKGWKVTTRAAFGRLYAVREQ